MNRDLDVLVRRRVCDGDGLLEGRVAQAAQVEAVGQEEGHRALLINRQCNRSKRFVP